MWSSGNGLTGTRHPARPTRAAALALGLVTLTQADPAPAAYGSVPASHADPELVRVDEDRYLGAAPATDTVFVDDRGAEFTLAEMLDRPLILVLSYFRCDGACTTINDSLRRTLQQVGTWKLGADYRVLTVSFDRHDNARTTAAFKQHIAPRGVLPPGWTLARFKHADNIRPFAQSVGYKFMWEPRDRVFIHPSVYLILSPEGRVSRFLYAASVSAKDLELSITKAYGRELSSSNVINFLLGACYSYNYEDGRYTLNTPLFIAAGALTLALTSLIGGTLIMKRRKQS